MTGRTKRPSKTSQKWDAARAAERYSSLRDLHVSYEGHSDTIITRLPDISSRGMFINTSKHFPEGAVLNVRFQLPRTGIEVQSRCEVRYCFNGVGVGVEFVDISPRMALAIERELSSGARASAKKKNLSLKPRDRKKPKSPRKKTKKRRGR